MALTPYSQKLARQGLNEIFGNSPLTDDLKNVSGCLNLGYESEEDQISNPDEVSPQKLVVEVLLGSSNSPVYFEIPSKIGNENTINGGITGRICLCTRTSQIYSQK